MKKKILTIAFILIIVGVAILIWDYKMAQETLKNQALEEIENTKNSKSVDSATADWQVFRNEKYAYQVKYPKEVKAEYIPSGMKDIDDNGYIIDFRFPIRTIRVYSSKNSRKDRTLQELVQVRNNIGMPIEGGSHDYLEKIINGTQAFQYRYSFSNKEVGYYISVNTVILGKDYYYQISTILPVGDEQYSKAEKMYDLFLNSFSLSPPQ